MLRFFHFCKSPFAFYVLFVLLIGAVHLNVQYGPVFEEWSKHRKAVAAFDKYWETEGAETFRKVGVEPTEKIYQEELGDYLKRFDAENPSRVPEKRIVQMKEEFRDWWEKTGKKSYAVNEIAPDEKLYQSELKRYIQGYTKNVAIYRLSFIPETSSWAALFTCWFLFPGLPSFLLFAVAFLFAIWMLQKRWGFLQPFLFFIAGVFLSGFIFAGTLSASYFVRYADTPYTGCSLALALLLGMVAFGPKREIPKAVPFIAIALFIADVLLNWNANPNLFGWVAILEIPLFGLGAFIGLKVPKLFGNSSTKKSQSAPSGEMSKESPKVLLRKKLEDAIELANKAEYEHASQIFSQNFASLFRENPVDSEFLHKTAEALLYPRYFFTIPGIEWFAWGSEAEKKGLFELAVQLFEKGASVEKDEKIRRRGLFYAGDIRLRAHLDEEKGKEEMKEVLELDSTDILAAEAQKWIGK